MNLSISYVLPLRGAAPATEEFAHYLASLAALAEVIVVDGSERGVFEANDRLFGNVCRHLAPHPELGFRNGKVDGVMTGLREASFDRVVVADDDVRYGPAELDRMADLLKLHECVCPQNYFDPAPWHARWDGARSLLNRAFGSDYPGTLGVRRRFLLDAGGYDGDVLFENLELMRTVRAAGGRVFDARDLFVRRLPPSTRHFVSQRVRQAYDDFAQPPRLALSLAALPAAAAARRRPRLLGAAAGLLVLLAEAGRRRDGARRHFPASTAVFAPLWAAERAVCAWVAVGQRLMFGGCRYRGGVIPRAATSPAELEARLRARGRSFLWEPSQNGEMALRPQRHSAMVLRRGSMGSPPGPARPKSPRTRKGPPS